jgi:hypothetical protein
VQALLHVVLTSAVTVSSWSKRTYHTTTVVLSTTYQDRDNPIRAQLFSNVTEVCKHVFCEFKSQVKERFELGIEIQLGALLQNQNAVLVHFGSWCAAGLDLMHPIHTVSPAKLVRYRENASVVRATSAITASMVCRS